MPDDSSPMLCRCGHPRSSHGFDSGQCVKWTPRQGQHGIVCTCRAFDDSDGRVTPMPDEPQSDPCRCGHPRTSHGIAAGRCMHATRAGTGCTCGRYVNENPMMTARRNEALHELVELAFHLDHRYAKLPVLRWMAA